MKNKYFILLTFCFSILSGISFSQDSGIYDIKFKVHHLLRIPNHEVMVELQKHLETYKVHVTSEPLDSLSEKFEETRRDYSFSVTKDEFEKVVKSIKEIDCTSIISGLDFVGFDGILTEITFGNYANGISYKVWTPTHDTKNRNLQSYLKTCQLILKTGKLNPKKIF